MALGGVGEPMKLADKFELSRGRALDEIEQTLEDLRDQISDLKQASSTTLGAASAPMPPPIASEWVYGAREFPFFTENLYVLEDEGEFPKRWVGPDASLHLALRLRRDLRYSVAVKVADFAVPGGETGLEVLVDGQPIAHDYEEATIRFEAPDNLAAFQRGEGLSFAVRIADEFVRRPSESDADQRTLSFSITSIEVMRADR